MQETLRMMNLIRINKYKKVREENLSYLYKVDKNPSILAEMFSRKYLLILTIGKRFNKLNSQDLASYSLEILDYCLLNYNDKIKASFNTYFYKIFFNKCRELEESLNCQKRNSIFNSISYDELLEKGFDISYEEDYTFLEMYGINDKEKKYCKLLSMSYTNKEISKMLKVSIMTLCKMRKVLRKKFIRTSL